MSQGDQAGGPVRSGGPGQAHHRQSGVGAPAEQGSGDGGPPVSPDGAPGVDRRQVGPGVPVVAGDPPELGHQPGAGRDAQPGAQRRGGPVVRIDRGLPVPGAVQRRDQQEPQLLTQRMKGHQRTQARDDLGRRRHRQCELALAFHQAQPFLQQRGPGLGGERRHRREGGDRVAGPLCQRGSHVCQLGGGVGGLPGLQRLTGRRPEAEQVHRVRCGPQDVSAAEGPDPGPSRPVAGSAAIPERRAQPGDVNVQSGRGRGGRPVVPQPPVDLLHRYLVVDVPQQRHQ
nr:hypothetical protein Ade03nite_86230 [Actinoplanes derwentensis]